MQLGLTSEKTNGSAAAGRCTEASLVNDRSRIDGRLCTANGDPVNGRQRVRRLRVVIADPDALARKVIRDLLNEAGGFVVAAEAADGIEAVELAGHYQPELVVTEVNLPRVDGVAACREICARMPSVRVVMFSVPQPRQIEVEALCAGACGFLSKNAPVESIAQALRSAAGGDAAISRSLTMHLIELVRLTPTNGSGVRPVKSDLTPREWEVLDLLCAGATTRDIAETLFISEGTVYCHSKNLLRKLGVHSRKDAITAAAHLRRAQNGSSSQSHDFFDNERRGPLVLPR